MEDIEKLLEQDEDYAMSSFEDNDSENEELTIWNLERSTPKLELFSAYSNGVRNAIKRNGKERLPTRKPDPNVYNRNALLARENRRKKKIYLEMIEKELHDARKSNRALMKALKRQLKVGKRLKEEKKYFQSLIANRSDVLSVVSGLNINRIPSESDNSGFSTSSFGNENISSFSGDPATTKTSCGSSSYDPDLLSIHFDNPSDDLKDVNSFSLPTSSSWDDIWSNQGYYSGASNDLLLPITTLPLGDTLQIVHDDHCYVAANSNHIEISRRQSELSSTSIHSEYSLSLDVGTEEIFVGICSHNADGKVSADFCPSCHWNLTSRTPPLQLLNDESFD